MDEKFLQYYKELYKKPLVEPESQDDVEKILDCLRARNGYLDPDDEAQLKLSSPGIFHQKMMLLISDSREVKAEFTKTISSQLYDDPFRFFYELIQNADDASYTKAAKEGTLPCVTFRVRKDEICVELNEDGFSLADVLAICSTGKSSKVQDAETTGEKGFGFKSVFGIASKVHIQSGLWSFSFKHDRDDDGLGMISPVWQQPKALPHDVRTMIHLDYGNTDETTLSTLFQQLEHQPVTILSFLRKIKKLKILYEGVPAQHNRIVFENLKEPQPVFHTLSEERDGDKKLHYFCTFSSKVRPMPTRKGRLIGSWSEIVLRFPVCNYKTCEPLINEAGQYVFAYLPIRQITQLPFIIQADFLLPASRQDIPDNAWNRVLRNGISSLFAQSVTALASQSDFTVRYRWLRYLPRPHLTGFWEDFLSQIKLRISEQKPFVSQNGTLFGAKQVRLIPQHFLHNGEPLIDNMSKDYSFLSLQYDASDKGALQSLGVNLLSYEDMLFQVRKYSVSYSGLNKHNLSDTWHESFAKLLKYLLARNFKNVDPDVLKQLQYTKIFPIRNGQNHQWQSMERRSLFFPVIAEEHTETEDIQIIMPTDVDIEVLHPDATKSSVYKEVFELLGVKACSRHMVCSAVMKAQQSSTAKSPSNLLTHFEILFWYKYGQPSSLDLKALTQSGSYGSSKILFFQSEDRHHAANLVDLKRNAQYQCFFLHDMYQKSQVSTRSRGLYHWTAWLKTIAGVRWYPPLHNPMKDKNLHPLVLAVNKENPKLFLSMIQEHWVLDYALACQDLDICAALTNLTVECRNGQKAMLKEAWFPSFEVLRDVDEYGVELELPIIALPNAPEASNISSWPSLATLGILSTSGFNLYKLILLVIASRPQDKHPNLEKLTKLYEMLGRSTTISRAAKLKKEFAEQKLIWDPESTHWCSSNECVWQCKVPLDRKFAIAGSYPVAAVQDLFKTFLAIGDANSQCLIDELIGKRELWESSPAANPLAHLTVIYQALENMMNSKEARDELRSKFKSDPLIFSDNSWHKSGQCIWHESVSVGGHIPIKADFPSLKTFFVTILEVNTITDSFMMKELARAASAPSKNRETIKMLMLDTSSILSHDTNPARFNSSLTVLRSVSFLPCSTPSGDLTYCSVDDTFFLADDERYTNVFQSLLCLLDFTYLQMNILHNLVRLLDLEKHYLTKNVVHKTEPGDSVQDHDLTARARECSYAISCCAVFHNSPLYLNNNVEMHGALQKVVVSTSPNIHTTFSVMVDRAEVKAAADKASVWMKVESNRLRIVVPRNEAEQTKCLRAELPKILAKELRIWQAEAVNQIYRFINEIDTGTDQLLSEEGIPHASEWLTKTERVSKPLQMVQATVTDRAHEKPDVSTTATTVYISSDDLPVFMPPFGTAISSYQRHHLPPTVPARVDHMIEAPRYGQLLEHLYRQAVTVKWRSKAGEQTLSTTSDSQRSLVDLRLQRGNSEDPCHYHELFGSDEYFKFRVGAAGELFAYGILKSILDENFGIINWPSSIRHYARAHKDFKNIAQMPGCEIADITYTDTKNFDLARSFYRLTVGDFFFDWLPPWLRTLILCDHTTEEGICDSCNEDVSGPIEWLFEVKTTLGPCETAFFMSESQYAKMRTSGSQLPGERRRVYCIIRVYDLLKETVGVRLFIDPFRFQGMKLEFTAEQWRVKSK